METVGKFGFTTVIEELMVWNLCDDIIYTSNRDKGYITINALFSFWIQKYSDDWHL
jgi:hypothetical protein